MKHPIGDTTPSTPLMTGLQTLLTAASAIEEQQQQQATPISPDLWNSTSSPWSDPYETITHNRYTDPMKSQLFGQLSQLKQEAVVYSKEEFHQLGTHPLCIIREVAPSRKGLVSEANIPEDEMIMEYKVGVENECTIGVCVCVCILFENYYVFIINIHTYYIHMHYACHMYIVASCIM